MGILILRQRAEKNQILEMLAELETLIKLAVDVERRVIAGGGEYHSDCEEALLNDGSKQDNVWGADWEPQSRMVSFGAMINIRPRLGKVSYELEDDNLRVLIEKLVREYLDMDHW